MLLTLNIYIYIHIINVTEFIHTVFVTAIWLLVIKNVPLFIKRVSCVLIYTSVVCVLLLIFCVYLSISCSVFASAFFKYNSKPKLGDRGSTVVKVLCYKSEGRWFDPCWCQWIFSWT